MDVFDEPQGELDGRMFGVTTKGPTVTGHCFSDQQKAGESTDGWCLIVAKITMEADANRQEELVQDLVARKRVCFLFIANGTAMLCSNSDVGRDTSDMFGFENF